MRNSELPIERLTAVAREYCDFIESVDAARLGQERQGSVALVGHLSRLLPRLHAAIAVLGDAENARGFDDEIDLERRFDLYSRLHELLGEMDAYWMEFDVARDGQEKSGSLADDLTDIYWELKVGLQHLRDEADLAHTLRSWGAGYRLNWGQHLVDAERHLYELSARDELRP